MPVLFYFVQHAVLEAVSEADALFGRFVRGGCTFHFAARVLWVHLSTNLFRMSCRLFSCSSSSKLNLRLHTDFVPQSMFSCGGVSAAHLGLCCHCVALSVGVVNSSSHPFENQNMQKKANFFKTRERD